MAGFHTPRREQLPRCIWMVGRKKMIDLSRPQKKEKEGNETGTLILALIPILTALLFLLERSL